MENDTSAMSEKINAALKQEGKRVRLQLRKLKTQLRKLENGSFFERYTNIWEKDSVGASSIEGKFDEICRPSTYSDGVLVYKELLDRTQSVSEQRKTAADGEAGIRLLSAISIADSSQGSDVKGKKSKRDKNKKKKKGNIPLDSGDKLSELPFDGSHSLGSRSLDSLSLGSVHSQVTNVSQQDQPDFAGRIPSTRAHMIPNRAKNNKGRGPQTCYKYYNVICQAVLGFSSNDVPRLDRIAFEMADSDYNFLRSPSDHGKYLDTTPCWILIPACSFDAIKEWTPGTRYPVLAVADGYEDITTEMAYKLLCTFPYTDDDDDEFDETIESNFKRSKCTKPQLVDATENLSKMVLAMAETLEGRSKKVKPYQKVANKNNGLDEPRPDKDQWTKKDYDVELFRSTKKSIRENGVQVPKLKSDLAASPDLDGVELLVFHLNSAQVDIYPDPMLLLIKAAINWSFYCGQKLLPACGGLNVNVDVVPTSPIPAFIEFRPMPVTPDQNL